MGRQGFAELGRQGALWPEWTALVPAARQKLLDKADNGDTALCFGDQKYADF